MMADPLHQSWEDLHENSTFPFTDGATLRSTDRKLTLPKQAIRDMVLATPLLNAHTRMAIIERTISNVILTFQQGNTVIATAVVVSIDDGWVQILDDEGVAAGRVKIDQVAFATLFGTSVGVYRFNAAATTLVPWVTFYRPRNGLRGFRLPDGTVLTGEVTIIAGDGLQFDEDGYLSAVGEPTRNIPDDGLIPRAITQLILDDGVTTQVISPQKAIIIGRTIGTGGRPPALTISNPTDDVARLEVTG